MNTIGQTFGGDWTEQKLERLSNYLHEYTKIMNNYDFHYSYIDAFAGTGYRELKHDEIPGQMMLPDLISEEALYFLDGSARIALQVERPFKEYVFIEKKEKRFSKLKELKNEFPNQNIKFINTDANEYLISYCDRTNWNSNRAVVFLDPYGMQVRWKTIESIARTKAIDLWILFPLGTINRLLERQGQTNLSKQKTLDEFFGNTDWRTVFYPLSESLLFQEKSQEKIADIFAEVGKYFIKRLREIFPGVAENPLQLYNSKSVPLYLLCFAAANEKGSITAVKIAQHILDPSKGINKQQNSASGPQQLKLPFME